MNLNWGNWDVRVYAANSWIALAPRFASDQPIIIEHLELLLSDPVPSVRLQVAQNLQVLAECAPDRMWELGRKIAEAETNVEVIAGYVSQAMAHFGESDPERCESILDAIKSRLDGDLTGDDKPRNYLQEVLGDWTAHLYVDYGRSRPRAWLEEWASNPGRFGELLNAFVSPLRGTFFLRYSPSVCLNDQARCDRAQAGLQLILEAATSESAEAYATLLSDAPEESKEDAAKQYRAAEQVIGHSMNQLYFGSGAYKSPDRKKERQGLSDIAAMRRFLGDYENTLGLLAASREPSTLHHLLELYEYLIPCDPVSVFRSIHAILFGRGEEQGYHNESLGNTVVVRIVQCFIADHRIMFEDEDRRVELVAILELFSEVGWPEALKLLYELPDLLR